MASCPGTLTAATATAAAGGAVVVTTSCREYLNPLLRAPHHCTQPPASRADAALPRD